MISVVIISGAVVGTAAVYLKRRNRRACIQREVAKQRERQQLTDSYNIRLLVYTTLLEQFPSCRSRQEGARAT